MRDGVFGLVNESYSFSCRVQSLKCALFHNVEATFVHITWAETLLVIIKCLQFMDVRMHAFIERSEPRMEQKQAHKV